jgi:hypothetical protein
LSLGSSFQRTGGYAQSLQVDRFLVHVLSVFSVYSVIYLLWHGPLKPLKTGNEIRTRRGVEDYVTSSIRRLCGFAALRVHQRPGFLTTVFTRKPRSRKVSEEAVEVKREAPYH